MKDRTTRTPTARCCRAACAPSARPARSGRTTRLIYEGEPGILFCSDLVSGDAAGGLHFVDPAYHEDPVATQTSVEHLLGLQFGDPVPGARSAVVEDPKAALREVLEQGS